MSPQDSSERATTIDSLAGKSVHIVGASGAEGTALLLYLAEGLGITGLVAHDFSADFRAFSRSFRKANLAWDKSTREDILRRLRRLPVEFRLGDQYLAGLKEADVVLASQNWFNYPSNLPAIPDAVSTGSQLLGLVDLALDLFEGTRIGVTGSNGKSTTSALISHLLKLGLPEGRDFLQGGNDRERQVALADLEAASSEDILLWEVSNRHLRDRSVAVDIAVVTNITRNHIEDHGSWEAYIAAKLRLPRAALSTGGHAILCSSDPVTQDHLASLRSLGGTLWTVGEADSDLQHEGAAWKDEQGRLKVRCPGTSDVLDLGVRADLPLAGSHNVLNFLIALCAALATGVPAALLRGAIASFGGLSGRLEEVATHRGVRWVYDIQATTAPAAEAGIIALAPSTQQLILMVGGEDKGMDYGGMANAAAEAGATVLALPGSGTEAFLTALAGRCGVVRSESLDEMIETASGIANRGAVILLSPGCAFFHREFIESGASYRRRVHDFLGAPATEREA